MTMSKTVTLVAFSIACLVFNVSDAFAQATDLDCSKCVDGGDIADGAVTGVKLAPNAINNSKIGNGAVNAAKLAANAVTVAKIANNAVSTSKLTTASVTRPKIAPNAVNAAKIANAAVTAAKIAPGAVNQFKIADGAITADKLGLANTVVIEDSGDDVANCTALRDALAALTGPSTVLLGPGNYDCGSNQVVLTTGVNVVGTARSAVTITGNVSDGLVALQGDNILLKGVTVVSAAGAGGSAIGVVVGHGLVDTRNWRIKDSVIEGTGGDMFFSTGIRAEAVDCDGGEIKDVSALGANGTGIIFSCTAGSVTATALRAAGAGPVPTPDW